MAWTATVTISTGDLVTAAYLNTYVSDNVNWLKDNCLQLIETTSPTGTTVTFTSIPGTFTSLLIRWYGRTDRAGGSDTMIATFNNDVGANYNSVVNQLSHNATHTSSESVDGNSLKFGGLSAANGAASVFSQGTFEVLNYANTTGFKSWHSNSGFIYDDATGEFQNLLGAGFWESAAAITEIDVDTNGGDNFIAGSKFSLYGVP